MPDSTLALQEASWLLSETVHQLSTYTEDRDQTWIPMEDVLGTLGLLRWLVDRESEDSEPPQLRPV